MPTCNAKTAIISKFVAGGMMLNLKAVVYAMASLIASSMGDEFESQLYEDLLYTYNRNVRPNKNATDILLVKFASSLIRIIDVDEVNQQLKVNLWLEMQWYDNKFKWDPHDYGGIWRLHVPSDRIWTPDIVLYNTADGDYEITSTAAALIYFDGTVVWKPPQIYTSFCKIDISYFPYDVQRCPLKFGGWTYHGFYMDMQQIPVDENDVIKQLEKDVWHSDRGMDLSYFSRSIEWDLVNLTSERRAVMYPGCCGHEYYIDITYYLTLRRKTLFFTCNLIIPSMLVAVLTTFVFYIPSADHKITFSISILLQQTVFYNIMMDLLPPSSDALPLFGQYLLFTIILVSTSIFVSVVTLNLHRRKGVTNRMPKWMRVLFLRILPTLLCLKPWEARDVGAIDPDSRSMSISDTPSEKFSPVSPTSTMKRLSISAANFVTRKNSPFFMSVREYVDSQTRLSYLVRKRGMDKNIIERMIDNVQFITDHFRAMEDEGKISQEWAYVAMVIDRLFFIIFSVVNIVGTVLIIKQGPPDPGEELPRYPQQKPLGGETLSGYYNMSM